MFRLGGRTKCPSSFEFGNGGACVSEEPHMTFLKDTDGDGKADLREIPLT